MDFLDKSSTSNAGRSVDEASENEISISWVRSSPLSKRAKKTESDTVECVYAFNNKAISGVPIAGLSAGRKTVLRKTLAEVHQQMQCLLEMAENEQTLLQSTYDFNCVVNSVVLCGWYDVRYSMVW